MPKSSDAMGKDNDMNHELPEPQSPQLGATHEANAGLRGEFRIAANVPPEHRIPADQLPEPLRKKFPEGMPIQSGGALPNLPGDPRQDILKQIGLTPEQMGVLDVLLGGRGMEKDPEKSAEQLYLEPSRHLRRYSMAKKMAAEQWISLEEALKRLPPYQKVEEVIFKGPGNREIFASQERHRRIHHLESAYAAAEIAGVIGSPDKFDMSTILEQDPDQPAIETSIFWATKLAQAASQGEGFSNIAQFEEAVRPFLKREGLRGLAQMQFRLSVQTEDEQVYTGDISPARFWNVIDDPEFSQRLLEAGWGEADKILLDPDIDPPEKKNYLAVIGDVYKEVMYRYLKNEKEKDVGLPKTAKILKTNAYHWAYYTGISVENLKSIGKIKDEGVRDNLIGSFWGMYKAAFNIPFYFGRFAAWDKRAKGRIEMPELRKAYLPHIYYGQLYKEGEVTNEDLMMCAYWHDLITMKFEKLFPAFEAKFIAGKLFQNIRDLKQYVARRSGVWQQEWDQDQYRTAKDKEFKEFVDAVLLADARTYVVKQAGEGAWLKEWDNYRTVEELQKAILRRHTTRMGYSPARAIFGSMVVAGLRGEGPFAPHNIRDAIGWMENLKQWTATAAKAYRRQHEEKGEVIMIPSLGQPPLPPDKDKKDKNNPQVDERTHKALLDRIVTGHFYDPFFKGPIGEALPFVDMARVPWTTGEEILFGGVDFGLVLQKIGQQVNPQERFGKAGLFRLLGYSQDGTRKKENDGVGFEHFNWEKLEPKDLGSQQGYAGASVASSEALYKLAVGLVSNETITELLLKEGVLSVHQLDQGLGKHLAEATKDFVKAMAYFEPTIRIRMMRDLVTIAAQSACEARPGSYRFRVKEEYKPEHGSTHYVYEYETTEGLKPDVVQWLKDRTWQVCEDLLFNPSRDPVKKLWKVSPGGKYAPVHYQFGGRVFGHNTIAEFAKALADITALNKDELALALASVHAETARDKVAITKAEDEFAATMSLMRAGQGFAGILKR